jgi:hypothetical protein
MAAFHDNALAEIRYPRQPFLQVLFWDLQAFLVLFVLERFMQSV